MIGDPIGRRRSRRRLFGLDRSGPAPRQTRAGQPLRPLTLPNLIGYIRLAAIPVFLAIAFNSGDGRGRPRRIDLPRDRPRRPARRIRRPCDRSVQPPRRPPRPGRRPVDDPRRSRRLLAVRAPARTAIVLLAIREVATLGLARYGLRHGADLEITWFGRIAVFLIMGGIFWSMVFDWLIIEIGFCVGVALAILATILYVRDAMRGARIRRNDAAERGGAVSRAFNLQVLIDPSGQGPIIAVRRPFSRPAWFTRRQEGLGELWKRRFLTSVR